MIMGILSIVYSFLNFFINFFIVFSIMFGIYNFYDVEECSFYSLFVQKFYYEETQKYVKGLFYI